MAGKASCHIPRGSRVTSPSTRPWLLSPCSGSLHLWLRHFLHPGMPSTLFFSVSFFFLVLLYNSPNNLIRYRYLPVNSYPVVLANTAVSAGLLFLRSRWAKVGGYDWVPPFSAWKSVTVFFLLSNIFLTIVPLVPPSAGYEVYERLPYCVSVPVLVPSYSCPLLT